MNNESYMQRAIDLALQGLGRTSPNPMVGAVVVKNNKIVGEGYHRRAGTPHAEVHALRVAGKRAFGATLYVTLEPCPHYGRTPPCVDAILDAGIKHVCIGTSDPNPDVNGMGIKMLKKYGIKVEEGILGKECKSINEVYNKYIVSGIPHVIVKAALSLDGKIATSKGESKWITNDACRQYVHELRSRVDAVTVGSGTVRTDNPRLDVRGVHGKNPYAVIVDEKLSLSKSANVFKRKKGETIVLTTVAASKEMLRFIENKGHKVIVCRADSKGLVFLPHALDKLGKLGITSILVEGGGKLFADFFRRNLIDKFVMCLAPKIIGGCGMDFLPKINIPRMKNVKSFSDVSIKIFGDNVVVEGKG